MAIDPTTTERKKGGRHRRMNDDPQHICQPSKDYLALAEKSGTSEMVHANILRRIKFNFIYVFLRA